MTVTRSTRLERFKVGEKLSARKQNRIVERVEMLSGFPGSLSRLMGTSQRETVFPRVVAPFLAQNQDFEPGNTVELYEIDSAASDQIITPTYKGRQFVGGPTPNTLWGVVENGAKVDKWGYAIIDGYAYVNEVIGGGTGALGKLVGPEPGEDRVSANFPGAIYIAHTNQGHLIKFIHELTTGSGSTGVGQSGTIPTFTAINCSSRSGIQTATTLTIHNVFNDVIADNLVVHYRWSITDQHWEVTDIMCPPS